MYSFNNIDALSPSDQLLFNKFGKGPEVDVPFQFVQQAIEHFIDTQPDAIAAEHDGATITYQELEKASNKLANRLLRNGLQPRQRICLVVQRSISMVVAVLAVLKCGCQYIPLDGRIAPDDTVRHVLSDTQAKYVLCFSQFKARVVPFVGSDCNIIVLDTVEDEDDQDSTERPSVDILPTDGAYMIYTSGTTGKPKGVDVSHVGATNLLCLYPGNLGIKPGTKVGQCLSISFDMGQWEILSTLMNGGTLVLRTSEWAATLAKVHTLISTPSILQKYRKADYPNIKVAVVGGEPCPKLLADEWSNGCLFINCCGPTEVSILNTMLEYDPSRLLSIGSPIPNTNVYILDEDENPVPIGAKGYMWAGGSCVSRGYLNLPELTSTRYKSDKFTNDGTKMFNTGDLVRWLDDGNLEHQGRGDDQVKIKGFRVELDSVSSSIEKTPGVTKACAIFRDNVLWAFYSGEFATEAVLKNVVAKHQPYYAIPSRWEYRSVLPLTLNGKIDKRALMASVMETSESLPEEKKPSICTEMVVAKDPSSKDSKSSFVSTSSEVTVGDLEKGGVIITVEEIIDEPIIEELQETSPLPDKKGIHGLRALRYKFFSLYRRFFTSVFIANVATIIWVMSTRSSGSTIAKLATATATNLTVAVLMRQDHVVNALFKIFCSVPTWAPLFIRRNFARIFHIGGIHSGAGVAATLWFLVFTVVVTVHGDMLAVIIISWIIVALLLAIVITAYPTFRQRFHNRFELTHRFSGWTALALFWIHTILTTDATRASTPLGKALVITPGFWLLLLATCSVILPWLTLRKVEVRADVLSKHAVRLYFDYCTPAVGSGVRLSNAPLLEWHAFAAIPKPQEKGFSLLVSNAGDWTQSTIASPPTSIWVRGVPACGVLTIAKLFKSVVLVATGSGIGPCLPLIYARSLPVRIIWSTPRPRETFGSEILDSVYGADEKAIVWDTKSRGRPDLVSLVWKLYKESGAEAVCVISNQKVTQMVVYGMESRGCPAFGAVFDS